MLRPADYDRLKGCKDIKEAETILKGFGFSGNDLPEMLKNRRERVWETCLELCGGDSDISAMLIQNDFHNIKCVLKSAMAGVSYEELLYKPANIDCGKLYSCAESGSFETMTDGYREVYEEALAIYNARGAQAMELYLDRTEAELFGENTEGFMGSYAEMLKLCANLRIYLRSELDEESYETALCSSRLIDKTALIIGKSDKRAVLVKEGYGEAWDAYRRSPELLDKWCREKIYNFLGSAEYDFFGIGAIVLYFVRAMEELVKIRLALAEGAENV